MGAARAWERSALVAASFAGLLIFSASLLGEEPAPFHVGPWHPGMSRDEVKSFSEFGPYEEVRVTGGLETSNAQFLGEKTNISFVFDAAGLQYIQVWSYEGKDSDAAQAAVLKLYSLFVDRFGGAEIKNVSENDDKYLSMGAMQAVLAKILGTAKDLAEKTRKDTGQEIQFFFDMMPRHQASGGILHSRWGFSGTHDTFYVFLFQHRKDRPPQMLEANVTVGDL